MTGLRQQAFRTNFCAYSMQDNSKFSNQHCSISSNRSPGGYGKVEWITVCWKSTTKDSDSFLVFVFVFFLFQKKNTIFFRSWRFIKANGHQKESRPIKNKKDKCKALLCPWGKRYFYIILYNFLFYFYIIYVCTDTYRPL